MDGEQRRLLLERIYGPAGGRRLAGHLDEMITRQPAGVARPEPWSERDAWLIAYPDQFSSAAATPLATLDGLLGQWDWLTGVHVLPCFPWSSDDGFAVRDYEEIDQRYGSWDDIRRLSNGRTLMLDAVINHMSADSPWFQRFLAGDPARDGYFAEQDAGGDYSQVVRPRTTPLFHEFSSHTGRRQVWTTFSSDQVDLNYANPNVLEDVARVLLGYCAHGANALRLDAIGFMWKESGTTSIHLPETHALIAVLGSVIREAYPGTLVVSEVNVPHAENIAYLGTEDQPESDLIYQFSLPPLVLYAVQTGDCAPLVSWSQGLAMPRPGVSFLNFLASHDGVGVRPAEGFVPSLDPLLSAVAAAGGEVSYRELQGGGMAPYELNSTWFDLVSGDSVQGVERHLATHAVMMAMPGIPLVYAHSLFGSSNDHSLFKETGRARSLNRHKFPAADEVSQAVASNDTRAGRVFRGIRDIVGWRATHPAFHPEADHDVSSPAAGVLRIDRSRRADRATMIVNLSDNPANLDAVEGRALDGRTHRVERLEPWEHRWLS